MVLEVRGSPKFVWFIFWTMEVCPNFCSNPCFTIDVYQSILQYLLACFKALSTGWCWGKSETSITVSFSLHLWVSDLFLKKIPLHSEGLLQVQARWHQLVVGSGWHCVICVHHSFQCQLLELFCIWLSTSVIRHVTRTPFRSLLIAGLVVGLKCP